MVDSLLVLLLCGVVTLLLVCAVYLGILIIQEILDIF